MQKIPSAHQALAVLFIVVVFFGGAFLWFAFLLAGKSVYSLLTLITAVALILLTILYLFRLFSLRGVLLAAGLVLLGSVSAVFADQYKERKKRNMLTVGNVEVGLKAYQPFEPNAKVVKLDQPASLSLLGNLPVMDGATALYPVYAAFAQAVYPEAKYPTDQGWVRCTTTPHAYAALAEGRADIIFVAAPSEAQLAYAKEKGVEMQLHPIGKEAFVFFVNAGSSVHELSIDELKAIYSGKRERLPLFDRRRLRSPLVPYQRPEGSGSQSALIRMMDGTPLASPPTDRVPSGMGGMAHRVAPYRNYENALGFSFRFYLTEMLQHGPIRLLKINGVYPDNTAIRNGSYPLISELYAVTRANPSPNTQKLLEWILSEQGQEIVEKTGYVGIRGE